MVDSVALGSGYWRNRFRDDLGTRRAALILAIRLAVISALFALAEAVSFAGSEEWWSKGPLYPVFLALYSILGLNAILLRRKPAMRWVWHFQFVIDTACIAVLIDRTGGVGISPLGVLFLLTGIGAGLLLGLRGALVVATLNTAVFTLMAVADVQRSLATPDGGALPVVELSYLGFMVMAIYGTAFGVGFLARERTRSGEELQRVANLYENVVSSLSAGVITLSSTGRVTSLNRAAELALGMPSDEAIGRSFREIIREYIMDADQTAIDSVSGTLPIPAIEDSGELPLRRHESWMKCSDGQRRYLRFVTSELENSDGKSVGSTLIVDDLTEVQGLQERADREERLVQVGRLAAGIAHEIRNPLTAISGSLQVLSEDRGDFENRIGLLRILREETDRLNRLVDDFLALAKPDAGRRMEIKISDIVYGVTEMLAHDPRASDIETTIEVLDFCTTLGHPDSMRQVFWNLAINAATAMGGQGRLIIRVYALDEDPTEDSQVIVEVEDEGGGVSAEDRDHIFDPFYTRRSGGTGLGLALAQRAVEASGGRIRLEDGSKGARFVVSLPGVARNDAQEKSG